MKLTHFKFLAVLSIIIAILASFAVSSETSDYQGILNSERGDKDYKGKLDTNHDGVINIFDAIPQQEGTSSLISSQSSIMIAGQGLALGVDTESEYNIATYVHYDHSCTETTDSIITMDIWIQDVNDLIGWQMNLLYDPTILQVIGADVNQFHSAQPGSNVVDLSDPLPDTDGDYLVSALEFGGFGDSGSGVLARITFARIGDGFSAIDLDQVQLADSFVNPIGDTNGDNVYDGPLSNGSLYGGVTSGDDDGDGMNNCFELAHTCLDSQVDDANLDSDNDALVSNVVEITLSNIIEFNQNTNPCLADTDSDAFNDAVEQYIGTEPDYQCGSSGWPLDIDSTTPVPNSVNRISISDIISFLVPVRHFGTSVGDPEYDPRFDLIPGNGIFADDINLQDLITLIAGPTAFPPMLEGAKAFGGPECPVPPHN